MLPAPVHLLALAALAATLSIPTAPAALVAKRTLASPKLTPEGSEEFFATPVTKRVISNSNLTPDGYWHNRYHGLLSMAVYGDYNTTCPQTFTEAAKLKNFPNSTRPAWDVLSTFGPTPSGCGGFTAIIPEMNKAVIVFRGNYELEQKLPQDFQSWDALNVTTCPGCTVNSFALAGYLECKAETNNWEKIRSAYAGQGLVFSITGHGLGGMHSLIASADLNNQLTDYYSHNYGTPRTFNEAGAHWYNNRFNGEAAERGIYGDDTYTEYIPVGPNYVHTGTPFYYTGLDPLTLGPKYVGCWDANSPTGPIIDDPGCLPTPQPNTTALQDHYFYFSNPGEASSTATGAKKAGAASLNIGGALASVMLAGALAVLA
ncbi:hypothetical protein RQP46_007151 [Phenoliferia psychrophenolica]